MKGVYLNHGVHVEPAPICCACGEKGDTLYAQLSDRLFSAPGTWNFRKCPQNRCGLIWLDPRPEEGEIATLYEGYFTHHDREIRPIVNTWRHRISGRVNDACERAYLARAYGYGDTSLAPLTTLLGWLSHVRPALRADLDFSVMYLPAQKARLLDVGCGSGHMLQRMQNLGWEVEGVDFDPNAVRNAQRKELTVRLGSLEAQGYPDNAFDAIVMSHLLEHVHDPLQLLRESLRICKPGGHLVVVTPNSGSWGHRRFRNAWVHLDPPRHLHVFSLPSLRGLAEKAGFQRQVASTTIRATDWAFMASKSIQRTGKYAWGSAQPLHVQLWARAMQMAEWAILKGKPGLGEETVLMAGKS